jgi:DNA repair protein RAD51
MVMATPLRSLLKIKGISEGKALKMKDAAEKFCPVGFQVQSMGAPRLPPHLRPLRTRGCLIHALVVPVQTAKEQLAQIAEQITLSTGSAEFDAILQGGIPTGSITEVYGTLQAQYYHVCVSLLARVPPLCHLCMEPCCHYFFRIGLAASGKTQLCHMLAVTCQWALDKGGGEGKCLYIDTAGQAFQFPLILTLLTLTSLPAFLRDANAVANGPPPDADTRTLLHAGTFRADRLKQIAESHDMNADDSLENVCCAR